MPEIGFRAMGTRVGPYSVTSTLGQGTFGKVKLAQHQESGREFAIKILDKSDIKANELTVNVRREIAIMKALNHRNIVNLREVLSSKTKLYIVMDLVRGGELFDQIERNGELDEKLARKYFQQLVDGIDYCHRRGVCHRDLKPENLLVDENGTLKITDFGVSSMKGGLSGSDLLYTACGTPYYCAPEIINGAEEGYSGVKIDAWSCGIILFLLLTGTLPFQNEDMTRLYEQINLCRVDFPSWMPHLARDLISRLLTKDPENRYSLEQVKQHEWFIIDYDFPDGEFGRKLSDSSKHTNGTPGSIRDNVKASRQEGQQTQDRLLPIGRRSNESDGAPSSKQSISDPQYGNGNGINNTRHADTPNGGLLSETIAASSDDTDAAPVLKDVVSEFGAKPLQHLVRAALPGKPQKRIDDVSAKLIQQDIDCAEDLQFLAETLKTPDKLNQWLEEKSELAAVTCMRLANFFYH